MSAALLSHLRLWLAASRPVTLIAAILPVALGAKLAEQQAEGLTQSYLLLLCTLISAMAIQVATNFFNDLVDHQRGSDHFGRKGPKRLVAAGEIAPHTMLKAGIITLIIASIFALPLIWARGWIILVIGIPALYLSYGYTAKPLELAYRGFGEFFVILYFGIIAVAGSAFVLSGEYLSGSILLGLQAGLLASALIAINNLRDIEEDFLANKKTLAVKFGKQFAKIECCFFLVAPFLLQYLVPICPANNFLLMGGTVIALCGSAVILLAPAVFLKKLLPVAALNYLLFTSAILMPTF